MQYAELHAHSAYTFLEGTSQPGDLVRQAQDLSLVGLAVLDVDGFYSAVQTAQAAKEMEFPTVYGAELTLDPKALGLEAGEGLPLGSESTALRLPLLVTGQSGYHDLSGAISAHNLDHPDRRSVPWDLADLAGYQHGNWKVLTGTSHGPLRRILDSRGVTSAFRMIEQFQELFGHDAVVVESALHAGDSPEIARTLAELAIKANVPIVATGAVRCATPKQQPLADVLTATRLNLTLPQAEPHLPYFGSFLRSAQEMQQIHQEYPQAVGNAAEVAQELAFDLSLMRPQLPQSTIPQGHDDDSWLRQLTYVGARVRYGSRTRTPKAWETIDKELAVISDLGFSGYFLIVKDIVDYCAQKNILAQGRGSAANSAVCYSLQITAVDAVRHRLLFERFLSSERSEPPDIDIDIEAGRREEVIQYVYQRYGRDCAAQVANTITYRPRSSVRAVGKALGYSEDLLKDWSKMLSRGSREITKTSQIPELVLQASAALQKLPRHMGIHPGGIVLTRTPVSQICPVMWAAKEGRSVLQWDKEDCASAGLVKFDLLGLGMLTALRKAFNWLGELGVRGENGESLDLYNLPSEDPRVYDLLCAAETVGVFQVESRAQMNTLPRLRPREFYDLVIEVALIRPGPIQGRAVNPYLRRRLGHEPVTCHPLLAPILERTLGIPLFQEQLMQIAIVGAGFTPIEADQLRKILGSKHHEERMEQIRPRLFQGMSERGLPLDLQNQLFESLRGFAEFGFPESHAFSFAYLVYASSWLKTFFPEHFYSALLASQPMGFYSPASLLADARRNGIEYAGPSVVASRAEASVERRGQPGSDPEISEVEVPFPAGSLIRRHENWKIRLGLDSIKGLPVASIEKILAARNDSPFAGLEDFARRTNLSEKQLELLAQAGAFTDLGVSRRQGVWAARQVANPSERQPFIPGTELGTGVPHLPKMTVAETMETDYQALGLSTGPHPLSLMRGSLAAQGVVEVAMLPGLVGEKVVTIAGLVTHRQRPGTAGGVTFLSLEDETGLVNVVCTPGFWKRYGSIALAHNALVVTSRLEMKDGAHSVRAQKLQPLVLPMRTRSRDFC